MVLLWFLLALVLLVAALVLLRLDGRQRARESAVHNDIGSGGEPGVGHDGETPGPSLEEADPRGDAAGVPGESTDEINADTDAPATLEAEADADTDALATLDTVADADADAAAEADAATKADASTGGESGAGPDGDPDAASAEPRPAPFQSGSEQERRSPDEPERGAEAAAAATDPEPIDTGPARSTSLSARLVDRVRALLPAKKPPVEADEKELVISSDPLADSPVVRWLEERDFEPTPTPAPDFRHGDFAGGLPTLGTVSHGMFRGRRAIMGVTGGRTVLALLRNTSSDVILDLSRADVDASEPGFHDAGAVADLEARTSDLGRLDLIDRDRLAHAVRDLPADVRRIWAEGEWVAATVEGVDDPATWDDVVVALHGAADVLAPLPPTGGRARPLPVEVDPGAPGAADGPDADPAVGMDGGTVTRAADTTTTTQPGAEDTPAAARTTSMPPVADAAGSVAGVAGSMDVAETIATSSGSTRSGHLRLVPERREDTRDLTDAPVVSDRSERYDVPQQETATREDPERGNPEQNDPGQDLPGRDAPDRDGPEQDDPGEDATDQDAPVEPPADLVPEDPDPFATIMEPVGPAPSRGDVAADHLEPRPPLSRPTRGAGQAFPEDASVPPLAAGANSGGTGIKPLGSDDDENEIRTEVERFDAARTDGGSDLDTGSSGRHAVPAEAAEIPAGPHPDETPAPPPAGGGRHRQPEPESGEHPGESESESGRERRDVEPDVEETARFRLPPDIRD